jgi:hypothetical protein
MKEHPSPHNDLAMLSHAFESEEHLLDEVRGTGEVMPESLEWQALCQGKGTLRSIEELLRRRELGEKLSIIDLYPREDELCPDPRARRAWKSYKQAVAAGDLAGAQARLDELTRLL